MPRRPLGKTGLLLSILGFGAGPFGGWYEEIDEDECVRAVHEAFKLGINFFDVAPYYGRTRAETVLGRALKDLPRDQLVLSTKVGRYGLDEFDFSAARVTRSVEESCQRLNVDYVDIIICHDIEFVNLQQIVDETLPALHKLKQTGKVKFIGISGLPLKIFIWILDHATPGSIDLILSYCHFCLNDASLLTLIPLFEKNGVGVINASPLGMGLLTLEGPPAWHPAPIPLKKACNNLIMDCIRRGIDGPTMALKFSTAEPKISSTLVGMTTRKQVRENVEAVTCPRNQKDEIVIQEFKDYLGQVQNMTWSCGLLENNS